MTSYLAKFGLNAICRHVLAYKPCAHLTHRSEREIVDGGRDGVASVTARVTASCATAIMWLLLQMVSAQQHVEQCKHVLLVIRPLRKRLTQRNGI